MGQPDATLGVTLILRFQLCQRRLEGIYKLHFFFNDSYEPAEQNFACVRACACMCACMCRLHVRARWVSLPIQQTNKQEFNSQYLDRRNSAERHRLSTTQIINIIVIFIDANKCIQWYMSLENILSYFDGNS